MTGILNQIGTYLVPVITSEISLNIIPINANPRSLIVITTNTPKRIKMPELLTLWITSYILAMLSHISSRLSLEGSVNPFFFIQLAVLFKMMYTTVKLASTPNRNPKINHTKFILVTSRLKRHLSCIAYNTCSSYIRPGIASSYR